MFRRFFADSDIDARPAMDEEVIIEREPAIAPVRVKEVDMDSEDGDMYKPKHKNFLKTLIVSIVVFVIVLLLAMYIYNLIQKSALHSKLNTIATNLIGPEPMLIPNSGLGSPTTMFPSSLFPAQAAAGTPMMVANAQHTLMTPKSQVSSPSGGFGPAMPQGAPQSPVQAMGHNRVHFYYDGESSKESRALYREYCKLRKYCQRKEFRQQYGPVMFHKWDVSRPEGQNYFSQINLSGAQAKRNFPFCTYGRKGVFEEAPIGSSSKPSSKDMLNQMVQNYQLEKSSK